MSTKMASEAAHKLMNKGGKKAPSVIKDIVFGISIGVFAGYLWKMHHWNNQRRTRQFYDLLDRGLITVVVDDQHNRDAD